MIKRQLSILLILILVTQMFSGISFSLDIGEDTVVDDIRYVREHNGFSLISSFIEISGSALQEETIRLEKLGIGGGFEMMGEQTITEDGFIKIVLDNEDSNLFS